MGSPSINIKEDLITHPESSLVDNLINLLPFEIHAPGYHFCGLGTRLNERLEKGEKSVNPLDDDCRDCLIVCWPSVPVRELSSI